MILKEDVLYLNWRIMLATLRLLTPEIRNARYVADNFSPVLEFHSTLSR